MNRESLSVFTGTWLRALLSTLSLLAWASACGGGGGADDAGSAGGQAAASGGSSSGGQLSGRGGLGSASGGQTSGSGGLGSASGGQTSGSGGLGSASGGQTSGSGGAGLASGAGGSESDGDFFITGIVDGVERRMTTHLYGAVIPDLEPDQIALASKDDPTAIREIWQLQFEHVDGPQERPIVRYQDHDFTAISAWQLYPITVNLNAIAPNVGDVLEGTFEGTLITDSTVGATVEVTGGHFRVRRVNPN